MFRILRNPENALAGGQPADASFAEGGRKEEFLLASRVLHRDIPVVALLPPAMGKKPLPVLYALHGRDGSCSAFSEMKPLWEFMADHPMLVVSFQADQDSGYIDAPHRAQSLFTTFFFDELIPEIARRYPTSGEQAVTGFSMGGYGAFHYLATRPDQFSSVSAMSGAFTLFDEENGDAIRLARRKWLVSLVGTRAEDPAAWEAVRLAPRLRSLVARETALPPLLMLCGTGDPLKESNRSFVDILEAINAAKPPYPVRFEYRESPGDHTWAFWRDNIATIAEFHWRHFAVTEEERSV